jgi:hypothetical protein
VYTITYVAPTVPAAKKVTVLVNNKEVEDTLQNILDDAKSSSTVITLQGDITETGFLVNSKGATIDLNGNTLKAQGLFNVSGANIIDTSEYNTGILIIPNGLIVFPNENKDAATGKFYLPVWDSTDSANSGYRFLRVKEGMDKGRLWVISGKTLGYDFEATTVQQLVYMTHPDFDYGGAKDLMTRSDTGVGVDIKLYYQNIPMFKKWLAKQSVDTSADEYTYYNYLNTGMTESFKQYMGYYGTETAAYVQLTINGVENMVGVYGDTVFTYGINSTITLATDPHIENSPDVAFNIRGNRVQTKEAFDKAQQEGQQPQQEPQQGENP